MITVLEDEDDDSSTPPGEDGEDTDDAGSEDSNDGGTSDSRHHHGWSTLALSSCTTYKPDCLSPASLVHETAVLASRRRYLAIWWIHILLPRESPQKASSVSAQPTGGHAQSSVLSDAL